MNLQIFRFVTLAVLLVFCWRFRLRRIRFRRSAQRGVPPTSTGEYRLARGRCSPMAAPCSRRSPYWLLAAMIGRTAQGRRSDLPSVSNPGAGGAASFEALPCGLPADASRSLGAGGANAQFVLASWPRTAATPATSRPGLPAPGAAGDRGSRLELAARTDLAGALGLAVVRR